MLSASEPEYEYIPFIPRWITTSPSGTDLNKPHTVANLGVLLQIEISGLVELENTVDMMSENEQVAVNDNPENDTILAAYLLGNRQKLATTYEEVWSIVFDKCTSASGDILQFTESKLLVFFDARHNDDITSSPRITNINSTELDWKEACVVRAFHSVLASQSSIELSVHKRFTLTAYANYGPFFVLHVGGVKFCWETIYCGASVSALRDMHKYMNSGTIIYSSDIHNVLTKMSVADTDTGRTSAIDGKALYRLEISSDMVANIHPTMSYIMNQSFGRRKKEVFTASYSELNSHVRNDLKTWIQNKDTNWIAYFDRITSMCITFSGLEDYVGLNTEPKVAIFQSFFSNLQTIAEGNHGKVKEISLDEGSCTMMIGFGLPTAHPSSCSLAVTTAKALLKYAASNDLGLNLEVRVGIATGGSVAGFVGCASRKEYLFSGDIVKRSKTIMTHASAGQILVDSLTQQDAKKNHLLILLPHGSRADCPLEMRFYAVIPNLMAANKIIGNLGAAGPVNSHSFITNSVGYSTTSKACTNTFWRYPRFLDLKGKVDCMVGRHDMRTKINKVLTEFAAKRAPGCIVFTGVIGVGKSSLIAAALVDAISMPIVAFSSYKLIPRNNLIALNSFEAVVDSLYLNRVEFGLESMWKSMDTIALLGLISPLTIVPPNDSPVEEAASVGSVKKKPPPAHEIKFKNLQVFRSHIASKIDKGHIVGSEGAKSTVTLQLDLLVSMFETIMSVLKKPILIAIDDLQSVDEVSWLLIKKLLQTTGYFIISGFTQDDADDSNPSSNENTLTQIYSLVGGNHDSVGAVERFKWLQEQNKNWIHQVSGFVDSYSKIVAQKSINALSFPDAFAGLLQKRSAGNPLYIEELLRELLDSAKFFVATNTRVASYTSSSPIHLPSCVENVVRTNLEALPSELRITLMTAAVVGMVFTANIVARIHPESFLFRDVDENLSILVTLGWIVELPSTGHTFELLLSTSEDPVSSFYMFSNDTVRKISHQMLVSTKRKQVHQSLALLLKQCHVRLGERNISYDINDELFVHANVAYHHQESRQTEMALESCEKTAHLLGRNGLKGIAAKTFRLCIDIATQSANTPSPLYLANMYFELGTCYQYSNQYTDGNAEAIDVYIKGVSLLGIEIPPDNMPQFSLISKIALLTLKLKTTLRRRDVPPEVSAKYKLLAFLLVRIQDYYFSHGDTNHILKAIYCCWAAIYYAVLSSDNDIVIQNISTENLRGGALNNFLVRKLANRVTITSRSNTFTIQTDKLSTRRVASNTVVPV